MRRVCIFGAGAIGGELATHLAIAGAEVSVVARGALLDAIRARGITVRTRDGAILHCSPYAASDDPRDLGPQDAVVVAVKAPALPGVAARVAPLLGSETPVAFVMNGLPWWYGMGAAGPPAEAVLPDLDPGGVLHAAVGEARVIGGVVYSACTMVEPGAIHSGHASNKLVIGEPDGQLSDRALSLAALFEAGAMPCRVTRDIRAEVWGKLMTNLASGPICLLSRSGLSKSFADPVVRAAAIRAVQEGMAIANAVLGRPLGGTAEARIDRLAATDHKPSILQDLEHGRALELEALLLHPLRLARRTGVETPTLDLLTALASQAAERADVYRPRRSEIAALPEEGGG
ncbi:ketopantoate reductase family protein [Roseomonas populi]|uniref:2-dehydropantoate 2-reductase n=1 Tax=Roseomonas populi TaxID=3121582 RepID=A0ABT1X6S0_9PROT|nr:2-dehydropantoate 2-reductase [Roseomonas pecuniae]MCR0983788.1 2-dehydropantoate 2-reductase [Roseomonas pecuniae]